MNDRAGKTLEALRAAGVTGLMSWAWPSRTASHARRCRARSPRVSCAS